MFAKRLLSRSPYVKRSFKLSYRLTALTMASKRSSSAATLSPREFPTSGFEIIDPSQLVEEERLPYYSSRHYYPVKIGEVLGTRYQVLVKVGYGTSSTVWLCRDLRENAYRVIKVHVSTVRHNHELEVYNHLASVKHEHHGRLHVRQLEDNFKIRTPFGEHDCFVTKPLGMSLLRFQELHPDGIFDQTLVKSALDQILIGVDFLHSANVVHTDLHSDNLLIALTDDAVLSGLEQDEIETPIARKQAGDRFIYCSRFMLGGAGPLTICDLGQARIGKQNSGNAMPLPYRAPEVILNMPWNQSVDYWNLGVLSWDLLERQSLFNTYDSQSKEQNDAQHLAAMTALLGPPPLKFLLRSHEAQKYWGPDGIWRGPVELPKDRSLSHLAGTLDGDDKEDFTDFISSFLRWLPEERSTPEQAYGHRWLRGRSVESPGESDATNGASGQNRK